MNKNFNKENISLLAGGVFLGLVIAKSIIQVKKMIKKEPPKDFFDSKESLKKELIDAISNLGSNNVELIKTSNYFYGSCCHNEKNSYPVTHTFCGDIMSDTEANDLCVELNISYCEN